VTTNDNNKTKTIIEIQNGHKKVGQSNGKMANGNEESRSHGNGNGMTNGLATSSPVNSIIKEVKAKDIPRVNHITKNT
jgi:hypothetical protein